MQSKWLTWQPSSVGFEGAHNGDDSIIRRQKLAEDTTFAPSIVPELDNKPGNTPTEPTIADELKTRSRPHGIDQLGRVQDVGPAHTKLFPFIGRKVRTPGGSGVLLQVFAERVTVLLDSELGRCSFFRPADVEPASWDLP
jgi:hypothetical protein